ncbi:MAG TPA: hypothetical protein VED41_13900 [Solirubrobacteraceae bacterium]|nr:hypothetical protein [Solirubrobacteraceae bacterium]
MSECILIFRGFGRDPGWCHVIVANDQRGARAVLVGELDDNPGTSVTNAIEEVAESIKREFLGGDSRFALYQYVPKDAPTLGPTFYRIEWMGQPGRFAMPVWHKVEPDVDPWLRYMRDLVMEQGYTSKALLAGRKLEVVDSRERDDLPAAM